MTATHDATTIIRDLEDARYKAMLEHDLARFTELSHPELVYSHSSGGVDTLESYLDSMRSGIYEYHEVNHPIDFVRIVDDVALVVGEMNADLTISGRPTTLRNKCLAVWKRTESGWRFLAYQPTPVTGA
ncbi:nuclear transport factor 2 family protein [Rhodococcus pyridinivorans]|uniref:nuclear transport factor 2 family protein n=1 Tax=Rhodococcus pyridinivorans TaxID=103816 RepID=UPI00265B18A6|nr:nuclear transport factor 2 family protein [Rhodococcus pyridinivorans]